MLNNSEDPTIPVDERTWRAAHEIARQQQISPSQVLACAVERYRHEVMLQRANTEWAAVQRDAKIAAEIAAEDERLSGTLSDGLVEGEWW